MRKSRAVRGPDPDSNVGIVHEIRVKCCLSDNYTNRYSPKRFEILTFFYGPLCRGPSQSLVPDYRVLLSLAHRSNFIELDRPTHSADSYL